MTAGLIAAGLAAMLVAGLVRPLPPSPWRARRDQREAVDLAEWDAFRAAFLAARPERVAPGRRRHPVFVPVDCARADDPAA